MIHGEMEQTGTKHKIFMSGLQPIMYKLFNQKIKQDC